MSAMNVLLPPVILWLRAPFVVLGANVLMSGLSARRYVLKAKEDRISVNTLRHAGRRRTRRLIASGFYRRVRLQNDEVARMTRRRTSRMTK